MGLFMSSTIAGAANRRMFNDDGARPMLSAVVVKKRLSALRHRPSSVGRPSAELYLWSERNFQLQIRISRT
jgi:hypothetical protein